MLSSFVLTMENFVQSRPVSTQTISHFQVRSRACSPAPHTGTLRTIFVRLNSFRINTYETFTSVDSEQLETLQNQHL